MANRSHLYNLDFNPQERSKTKEDNILGVSEYAYRLPLAYKILLSGNPRIVHSLIWKVEEPIAIIGDSVLGKSNLEQFLIQLKGKDLYDPQYLSDQIERTKNYFKENDRNLKYFLLEAGEIYDLDDSPLEEQNKLVFDEIISLDKTIEEFYKKVKTLNSEIILLDAKKNEITKKTWFTKSRFKLSDEERAKIDKQIQNKTYEKYGLLGIDNWAKVLYYSL